MIPLQYPRAQSFAAAVALTGIAGFTAKPVTQKTIAADGSTVVKCEYSRNSYTLSFAVDAGGLMGGASPQSISGKYGPSAHTDGPCFVTV